MVAMNVVSSERLLQTRVTIVSDEAPKLYQSALKNYIILYIFA